MSTATDIVTKAMDSFRDKNRNLLASLRETPEEVFERTSAAASLDPEAREAISFFVQDIDQDNAYARKIAREDLHNAVYAAMAKHFHRLLANGTLHLAMKLTDEGDNEQLELRYVCGIEQRPAPAPVVPVLSYDDQLRWDFSNLPMDKLKAKKNANAQYRKRLNELLDGDTIKMQATTLHDGANL